MNNHPQAGTSSAATKHHHQENPIYYPVIDQGHLPAAAISGSNDLLSLFNVSSMYDWFVKPYLKPIDHPTSSSTPTSHILTSRVKRNKMEKSYGHYVADVGGRNSIKKDHQLETWISDPSFQESSIENFLKPFSNEVLCQSFTLQPGIYPGADSSIWVAEEGGPKKRVSNILDLCHLSNFPKSTTAAAAATTTTASPSQIPNGHSTGPLITTTTPYPSAQPTRTTSRTSITDSSSHHHINSQLNLHQHPLPVHSQHSSTTTPFLNNNSSNNPNSTNNNNNTNTGPNHQVALQS
ncbi:hypothetical protein PSTT_15870 [Puccinia striiformis]|uniref:Mediator of RNA polymerase II transcription subunit 19 n=1 Tax=Puccinia striiformis TaxID=27350 RepID=A0A2S4UFT9_9BASI|nr:hypothetical protein PSTT_15870 [Puccinia striiformis]